MLIAGLTSSLPWETRWPFQVSLYLDCHLMYVSLYLQRKKSTNLVFVCQDTEVKHKPLIESCLHFLRLTNNPVFSCSGQTIYEKHKLHSVLKLFKSWIQPDLLKRNSCLCDFHLHHADSRIHALPFSRRATLGSLCTGRIKSSTRVWRPHSGLDWLIWMTKWKKMWMNKWPSRKMAT